MGIIPPPLNDISTIVEARRPLPPPAPPKPRIILDGFCISFSWFGAKRRRLENDSRERQKTLDVYWWTRNMDKAATKAFLQCDGGGLLSGASFEKSPNWSVNAQEYQWFVRNGCTAEQMGAIISRLPRTEMEVWK